MLLVDVLHFLRRLMRNHYMSVLRNSGNQEMTVKVPTLIHNMRVSDNATRASSIHGEYE